ncbi:nuclear transport factor 2 family protein [Streptomyces sp. B3I8]|uniref:nuclear transport factor 2 family protein n=1 Tax=Streptomyces sp. B3I8 TaxID=3042303 RepID=UPI0027889F07|nr:nuclear transport factor 2 family protein [Streptomyces sp. B3I8]MDQ0786118.1 hypothetical protein [Streptomyces sp. B3I8]
MSWTRGLLAALAVCTLLGGSAGCGADDGHGQSNGINGDSSSPVGKVLEHTDERGRHYREMDKKDAPEVGIEVEPDSGDTWDVRLILRRFRLSPAGARPVAVAGRGIVRLYLDGRLLARLHTTEYRLDADLARGTHHLTARLYADDGTLWAVDGEPVERTADLTASGTGTESPSSHSPTSASPSSASPSSKSPSSDSSSPTASGATGAPPAAGGRDVTARGAHPPVPLSGRRSAVRTDGGGIPAPVGKAC